MLWDFFYEKGRLPFFPQTSSFILDTFPQQTITNDKRNDFDYAIDQRTRRCTSDSKAYGPKISAKGALNPPGKSIAKALVKKGIFDWKPFDGKSVYSAAVLAGDSAKIEAFKKRYPWEARYNCQARLEGAAVATALSLPPARSFRYALDLESGNRRL